MTAALAERISFKMSEEKNIEDQSTTKRIYFENE